MPRDLSAARNSNLDDVAVPRPPRKMDEGQPSISGIGGGQEDPSAALDQLFLELHDQLPKDARGKLAQLANEVQKLKDTSTPAAQTTPPRTPPPTSDQELAKREEENAEARQSSGVLTKGEVVIIYCTHVQHSNLASYLANC